MAEARLTASDKRSLLLWILLGIIGAFFAHKYFFRVFPEASVDFKVSRAESQKRAKKGVRIRSLAPISAVILAGEIFPLLRLSAGN